jgi:hypothetical protein
MSEINFEYKKLHPFKWFILQNYPFLEDSIDALTNYELFCKLGEMINNQNAPINEMGEQVETLTDSFNALHDYVISYLDDANLQPLINNKLDEMVEDGTLATIINQEVFGDIQDNITALDTKIDNEISNIRNNLYTEMVIIGDSFSADNYTSQQNITPWHYWVSRAYGMNRHNYSSAGNGFVVGSDGTTTFNNTFSNQLDTALADTTFNNDKVGLVVIMGGLNDILHDGNVSNIYEVALATFRKAVDGFKNAHIIFVGGNTFSSYPANRTYNNATYHYYDLVSNYMQASVHAGIESYIDSYMYVFDSYMFSGGYGGHPGTYGQSTIANYILSHGNYNGRTKTLNFADSGLTLGYLGDHTFIVSGTSTTSQTGNLTYPNSLQFDIPDQMWAVYGNLASNNVVNLKATKTGLAWVQNSRVNCEVHNTFKARF